MEQITNQSPMHLCPAILGICIFPYIVDLAPLTVEGKELLLPMLYALFTGLGASVLLLSFSKREKKPKWHNALAVVGSAVAFVWISTIANEVVGILRAFSAILNVSEAILGVTVFAMVTSQFHSPSDCRGTRSEISWRMSRWQRWDFP